MTGPPAPRITRLILQDFRSYAALDLGVDAGVIALSGENGAGKTNLLEAMSLFAAGRGLRRAELAEMARAGGSGTFQASLRIASGGAEHRLGLGVEARVAAQAQGEEARGELGELGGVGRRLDRKRKRRAH